MSEQEFFAKLRDILVYLYPEEADARRVANDADMNVGNIAFSPKAINNWTTILLQAQREHKTATLMAVTFRDYKENEKLSTGWHDYLVTVRNREVALSPEPTLKRPARWLWVSLAIASFLGIGILLRWSPSAIRHFIFPPATATPHSAGGQPPAHPTFSLTEGKPVAPLSGGEGVVSATLTSVPPTDIPAPTRTSTATPSPSVSGLVRVEGGELQPDLAESWLVDETGKVWHFFLRTDKQLRNGRPFTAKVVSERLEASAVHIEGFARVEIIDDFTFSILLTQPNLRLLEQLAQIQFELSAEER